MAGTTRIHGTRATALALVKKDLRLFVRDRTALFFAFALPIMLASVMGTALGGSFRSGSSGGRKIALAVEDRAGSDASRRLLEALEGARGLRVEVVEDARRVVADGDRSGGLVIGEAYGGAGGDALTLYRDPARQIASQVMLFELAPVLLGDVLDAEGSDIMGRVLDTVAFPSAGREEAERLLRDSFERVDAIAASAGIETDANEADPSGTDTPASAAGFDPMTAIPSLIGLTVEDLAPPTESGLPRSAAVSHAFSAMAVMMLLFNVVAAAGTLLEERAEGTLDRLRLTPSAGRAVLLGKAVVTIVLALAQLTVLFAFGAVVFRVPVVEHLTEIVVTSLVWAFSASALGLLFATACSTRKQLEGISTLVILGMSAIGGAWFPREVAPEWFQTVGLFTPVAWAIQAYEGALWYGKDILPSAERGGIGGALLVLVAIGVVFTVLASAFYRRRIANR